MNALRDTLFRMAIPRLAGTTGEADVREYLCAELEQLGLPVEREAFTFSRFNVDVLSRLGIVATAMLLVWNGTLYARGSSWLILPTLLTISVMVAITQWHRYFDRFLRVGTLLRSENIIARLPTCNPQQATRNTLLILMAHYDSKSSSLPIWPRMLMVLATLILTGFLCAVFLIIGVLRWFGFDNFSSLWSWLCAIDVVLLLALLFNRTGNRSPGAFDNACGVAAVLETARRLKESPPMNVDVWCVFTGAEEFGLCGAVAFLERHSLDKQQTYLLNLDTPFTPKGAIYYNRSFGLPAQKTSASLNHYLLAAAEKVGVTVKPFHLPLGVAADHVPFVRHGYHAACLVAPTLLIHSPHDAPERVPLEALEQVVQICVGVARELENATHDT
ncbi:MAG: M20/M25/M40 family metallo-hydrolase [Abditibacteriales bacterium]|nr:M28 family metallopeptidase [Blastocatellia bacterium]MDW8366082.1 M20/M25/M40 family metallo-hydrolase [Abditibacteriales bacterium]